MSQHLTNAGRRLAQLALWFGFVLAAHAAQADAFTAAGNFSRDDDIRYFGLVVTTPGTVTATSLGYAGGTTVHGGTIARGGFDSMLFLYNSAGTLVAQSDDGIGVPTDPLTGLGSDAALSIALGAGRYILALTQYDNFALGDLAAGFSEAGAGNFTPGLSGVCLATAFCDSEGNARTSAWALNITGVASIPEPATGALAALAALAALGLRRCNPGPRPA